MGDFVCILLAEFTCGSVYSHRMVEEMNARL